MNWRKYLVSSLSTTCWVVDGAIVAALKRDSKGGVLWAAESATDGVFEVGPVGLQSVDREKLAALLSSLQLRIEGATRAAVVLPSGWTRTYLLDFDDLPRGQSDLDQVVRWRLKKLLPVKPSELRISSLPMQRDDGSRPLVCVVGMERALADIEEAFKEVGVVPGSITTRVLALAGRPTDRPRLLAQQEDGFLTLLLTTEDVPRLIRTKPLAASREAGETAKRELNLALGFIRETLGVTGDIGLQVSAESPKLVGQIEDWRSATDGVSRMPGLPVPDFKQGGAIDRLGAARIEPAFSVISEGKS